MNNFMEYLMNNDLFFFILGDKESGKTTLIAKLQGNEDPKKGSGLEYGYIDVRDEYREGMIQFCLLDYVLYKVTCYFCPLRSHLPTNQFRLIFYGGFTSHMSWKTFRPFYFIFKPLDCFRIFFL